MVVVAIIGLLAVLAVPAFQRIRMEATDAAFLSDLRVLSDDVFEHYAITAGDYPPDVPPTVIPPQVVDYVPRRFVWTRATPIGGHWDWDRAPDRSTTLHGGYAGLSVVNPRRTANQMQQLDARIDDGDLGTGRFRSRVDGYILILE